MNPLTLSLRPSRFNIQHTLIILLAISLWFVLHYWQYQVLVELSIQNTGFIPNIRSMFTFKSHSKHSYIQDLPLPSFYSGIKDIYSNNIEYKSISSGCKSFFATLDTLWFFFTVLLRICWQNAYWLWYDKKNDSVNYSLLIKCNFLTLYW